MTRTRRIDPDGCTSHHWVIPALVTGAAELAKVDEVHGAGVEREAARSRSIRRVATWFASVEMRLPWSVWATLPIPPPSASRPTESTVIEISSSTIVKPERFDFT